MNIKNSNKILINKGIATLPTIILIGMITLAVVVSVTSLALNQMFISQGQTQSQSALFYAEAGARDALTRIARDKTYVCDTSNSCNIVGYYLLDFINSGCASSTDCAKVIVSSGLGTALDPKIITSTGIMKSSIRKMEVRVILDGGTSDVSLQKGEITSTKWTELTN